MHRANAAELAEEDGWILPLHFGDPLEEHRAVRSQVGILDLCHRGLLQLTGPDRVSYLQGLASNDVKNLETGKGIHAAFLNIQGKVLADARILSTGDSFFLDLWESLKDKILAHLNQYLIADDVQIIDLTGQYGMISLQGPRVRSLLQELSAREEIPSGELNHRTLKVNNTEIRVLSATHTGEDGYDLLIKIHDLSMVVSRLWEIGQRFCLRWIGLQAQEILRVENGIPRYGVDMGEDNILLETGLDHSVSFDKGCYLGQEIIERVRSRGHVNRKLVGLVLHAKTAVERGTVIYSDDKEIGKITSAVFSHTLERPVALGYVHRDYVAPGTKLSIVHQGESIPAEVSSLPFYKPPSQS